MNTQDLINEALQADGHHVDGYRKSSEPHNGITCEIIIRSSYNRTTGRFGPDTQRTYFWDASVRISRAKAEEILAGTNDVEEDIDYQNLNPVTLKPYNWS